MDRKSEGVRCAKVPASAPTSKRGFFQSLLNMLAKTNKIKCYYDLAKSEQFSS